MPNVQLPDGSVVAFPDGMPDAAINSAITQHLAGNQPTGASDSFINKATDMLSFGLNKPINAAGIAAIDYAMGKGNYGDLYDKNMAQQNAIEQREEEEHPYASAAGTGVGILGSMGTMVPATGAKALPLWQSIKAAAPTNAAIGATIGGLNAVGNASGDTENRLETGATGAVLGGAMGAAIPASLQTLGTGIAKIASPLIQKFTAKPGEIGTKKLAQAMMRDNITPEQAQTVLQNAAPGASIADVGGENTQGLARSIVNQPGAGKNDATNFLLGRQMQSGKDMQGLVKDSLNNNANYHDTDANLIAARKDAAAPHYKAAYQANPSMASSELNRILSTPAGSSALKDSVRIMQNNRKLVGMSDPELVEQAKLVGSYEPGSGGIAPGLNMETLDNTKKALDLAYKNSGYKDSSILSVKNDLLAEMDKLDNTAKAGPNSTVPEGGSYKQGRAAFSGPSQSLDALEAGRAFMKDDAEVSSKYLANLDPADRPFFQIGATRALNDKVGANPSAFLSQVTGPNRNQPLLDKLQAIFPSQQEYDNFINGAQARANLRTSKNAILGNSTTTKQLGEVADSGIDMGHLMEVAKGNYAGAAMKVGANILSKVTGGGLSERERQLLAKQMFSSDQGQNAQNLQALAAVLQGKPRTQRMPFNAASGQIGQLIGSALAQNGQ